MKDEDLDGALRAALEPAPSGVGRVIAGALLPDRPRAARGRIVLAGAGVLAATLVAVAWLAYQPAPPPQRRPLLTNAGAHAILKAPSGGGWLIGATDTAGEPLPTEGVILLSKGARE